MKDDGGLFNPYKGTDQIMQSCSEEYVNSDPSSKGITCRDWLAGLAMQGMLANCPENTAEAVKAFEAIPLLAYKMADAMIAESKK